MAGDGGLGRYAGLGRGAGMRADNPAKGVRLKMLTKRERFLFVEELARLGEAMATLERQEANGNSLAIVRLLILTGARRTEIASLRWDYVDFERGALRSPIPRPGRRSSRSGRLRWTCWRSCRASPPQHGFFRPRKGRDITWV